MSEDICGYFGKQLRISLDNKETNVEEIDSVVLKKYLGGVGYGARVLYDEVKKGIDPLSSGQQDHFCHQSVNGKQYPWWGQHHALLQITVNPYLGRIEVWRRLWTGYKEGWI